jgi:phosphoribosylglycinamide formyltransferase-1
VTLRVAILVSGGGSNMVALAKSMTGDHPARPVLVFSNDENAAGLDRATGLGIPVAALDHRRFKGDRRAFEAQLEQILLAARPDIICLAGFMRVLSPEFVSQREGQILNIHPSLLPKYKGLDTHARAIAANDSHAGCSVHLVTAKLDDGPILGQTRVPVYPDDTPQTLAARILPYEHRLYPQVLRRFASGDRSPLSLS